MDALFVSVAFAIDDEYSKRRQSEIFQRIEVRRRGRERLEVSGGELYGWMYVDDVMLMTQTSSTLSNRLRSPHTEFLSEKNLNWPNYRTIPSLLTFYTLKWISFMHRRIALSCKANFRWPVWASLLRSSSVALTIVSLLERGPSISPKTHSASFARASSEKWKPVSLGLITPKIVSCFSSSSPALLSELAAMRRFEARSRVVQLISSHETESRWLRLRNPKNSFRCGNRSLVHMASAKSKHQGERALREWQPCGCFWNIKLINGLCGISACVFVQFKLQQDCCLCFGCENSSLFCLTCHDFPLNSTKISLLDPKTRLGQRCAAKDFLSRSFAFFFSSHNPWPIYNFIQFPVHGNRLRNGNSRQPHSDFTAPPIDSQRFYTN